MLGETQTGIRRQGGGKANTTTEKIWETVGQSSLSTLKFFVASRYTLGLNRVEQPGMATFDSSQGDGSLGHVEKPSSTHTPKRALDRLKRGESEFEEGIMQISWTHLSLPIAEYVMRLVASSKSATYPCSIGT